MLYYKMPWPNKNLNKFKPLASLFWFPYHPGIDLTPSLQQESCMNRR